MNSRFCHLARDTLDLHLVILFCHLIIYSSMYLWIYLLETSLTVQSKNSRTSFIDSFLWSLAWHFRLSLVCGNLKPWHLDRHRLKTSNKQFSRAFFVNVLLSCFVCHIMPESIANLTRENNDLKSKVSTLKEEISRLKDLFQQQSSRLCRSLPSY